MPAAPTLLAGRYRLGDSLGRGGMGQVWLARDETLDRDVAIKEIVLPPELMAGERDAVQRRTLREARAAARLSHPHVVQVYDVLQADGRTWIVMEYVPSRSLQEVVATEGPLEPRRAAQIGLQILAALVAAHRAGVRHRDVKPANVLLAHDDRVVLTDFGIATIEGDSVVTRADLVLGSPEFMSPERARHGVATPGSDLWSLGATLYTAVEGRSPFHRGSTLGTLTALAADEPDPPQRAGVLEPVLNGLLRKDPDERIDAAETERLLRAAVEEEAPGRRRLIPRPRSTAAKSSSTPAASASPAVAASAADSSGSAVPVATADSSAPAGPTSATDSSAPDGRASATDSTAPAVPASADAASSAESAAGAAASDDGASPAESAPSAAASGGAADRATDSREAQPSAADSADAADAAALASASAPGEPVSSTSGPAAAASGGSVSAAADDATRADPPSPDATPGESAPPDATPGESTPTSGDAAPPDAESAADDRATAGATLTDSDPAPAVPAHPETAPPSVVVGSAAVPSPSPDRPRPARRRRLLVTVAAVILVLVVGAASWLALRSEEPDRTTVTSPETPAASAPAPAPSTAPSGAGPGGTVPGGTAPSPTTTGAAPSATGANPGAGTGTGGSRTRPALPPGWREHKDRTGFSVYVPSGWRQSREEGIVYFRGDGRVLGIDQTDKPKSDPVADWRGQSEYRVDRGDFPGYDEIHIKPVKYWRKAADWEFTFNEGGRQHVNNRGFVVSDKQAYGIWWQTRHSEWKEARPDLDLIFASFRPDD